MSHYTQYDLIAIATRHNAVDLAHRQLEGTCPTVGEVLNVARAFENYLVRGDLPVTLQQAESPPDGQNSGNAAGAAKDVYWENIWRKLERDFNEVFGADPR